MTATGAGPREYHSELTPSTTVTGQAHNAGSDRGCKVALQPCHSCGRPLFCLPPSEPPPPGAQPHNVIPLRLHVSHPKPGSAPGATSRSPPPRVFRNPGKTVGPPVLGEPTACVAFKRSCLVPAVARDCFQARRPGVLDIHGSIWARGAETRRRPAGGRRAQLRCRVPRAGRRPTRAALGGGAGGLPCRGR